jgi:hypothetical protein
MFNVCFKVLEKITDYKTQITNKFQITMSEITNSPVELDLIRKHLKRGERVIKANTKY